MRDERAGRSLDARMSVAEEKIDDLEQETLRHRDRLHILEGRQSMVDTLAERVVEVSKSMEAIAKRAALEAITLSMQHRDELGHRRWGLRVQWISIGIAAGGFIAGLVFQITH